MDEKYILFGYLGITALTLALLAIFTFSVFLKILLCEKWRTPLYLQTRCISCTNSFQAWMNYILLLCCSLAALGFFIYLAQLLRLYPWAWLIYLIPALTSLAGFFADPAQISAIVLPRVKFGPVNISLAHPLCLSGFIFIWERPGIVAWVGKAIIIVLKILLISLFPVIALFLYCT